MNKLLQQQIQDFFGGVEKIPADLAGLFNTISQSYDWYEKDKQIEEQSIDRRSKELMQLNERLQEEKEELSRLHEELHTLFANVGEVFFSIDIQKQQLVQISPACERIYGYSQEDFYRNADLWLDVVADEDRIAVKKNYPLILSGESWIGEYRICRKDKTSCWVETKLKPTLDENGQLVRIDGITADITARKEAEEKLKHNEERLRIIIDNEPECVKIVDVAGYLLEMNQAGLKMIDAFCEEDVKGKQLFDLLHPEDVEIFMDLHNRVCQGETGTASFRINSLKGKQRWMETHSVPLRNNDGVIHAALSVTRDVTEMKKSQQLLAVNEKRYRALVENSGDGVAIFSSEIKLAYISPAVKRILGYSPEEAMQLDIYSIIHPNDLPRIQELWQKILTIPGIPHPGNICRVLHKDGKWRWIEATLTNMLHDPAVDGIVDNFRDVTEQVIANRALRESEGKRRLIMNAALDAIICMDVDGLISFWNHQAEHVFGWKAEEVIGKPLAETIIPPAFREMHRKGVTRYKETGQGMVVNKLLELSALNKDNKEFPVELTIVPIRQDGEEFFCAFIRDITQRKKAEEKLQRRTNQLIATKNELEQSEKSLKAAQALARLGSWEMDFGDTEVARWSDEVYEILGVDKKEVSPTPGAFFSCIHPGDLSSVIEVFEKGKQSLERYSVNFRVLRPDGELRHVYGDCQFIFDKEGKPVRMYGIVHDVTERHEAEELLRYSESRLKQAQSIAHMGSWELDFSDRLFKWSDEAYRIYGMEPGEQQLTPESWLTFVHPDDLAMVKQEIKQSHSTLTDFSMYHRIVRRDGVIRHVLSETKFEFDHAGMAVGLYGIVHDVTDQMHNEQMLKSLNEQIQKRAEELSASNAELERFAYVASHDLQEPLRMVSSFLQLLQKKYDGALDETARQYISYAVNGADRMKQLILDLLEYSRVGTNRDELVEVEVDKVIEQVLYTFESSIREKNAIVNVQRMPLVKVNRSQMGQLFQNLVGNALKYNVSDVPEIAIGYEEKDSEWQFYVKDNGIGIDPKYFDKVFAIFQRLHNKNQFSGTGIGLAICKKITDRHGGNIWIESGEGEGSTFFFTIAKQL